MLPSEKVRWLWNPTKNAQKPWGRRMKEYMKAFSYQRCPDDMKIKEFDPRYGQLPVPRPYRLPDIINVAYNARLGLRTVCLSHK